jgi:hypothetical protein
MIDVYRKYGHRADLMVMFNCRSNHLLLHLFSSMRIYCLVPCFATETECLPALMTPDPLRLFHGNIPAFRAWLTEGNRKTAHFGHSIRDAATGRRRPSFRRCRTYWKYGPPRSDRQARNSSRRSRRPEYPLRPAPVAADRREPATLSRQA